MSECLSRASGYDERFKFTGKERDSESGYDFFGARFLWDPIGIWLSVDPLADKYPGLTPYLYCNGNPIKYIDPDGRIIKFAEGTTKQQQDAFFAAVQYLDAHNCGGRYGVLKNFKMTYVINMNVDKNQFYNAKIDADETYIDWNPNIGLEVEGLVVMSPAACLNHEFAHASLYDKAKQQYREDANFLGISQAYENYRNSYILAKLMSSADYGTMEEEYIITGIEQRTARMCGEIGENEVTRTNHGGRLVLVENSISTTKVEQKDF